MSNILNHLPNVLRDQHQEPANLSKVTKSKEETVCYGSKPFIPTLETFIYKDGWIHLRMFEDGSF